MSTQSIVSTPSAKPKVFRLPPAPPALPAARRRPKVKVWHWGLILLALPLVWPGAHKQTASYFNSHSTEKSGEHESLEGILQPPVADAQAALPAEKPPTIMLRGQSEAIIGQMAKIPSENEPIIETKSASEVDNKTGRELLSIISKY